MGTGDGGTEAARQGERATDQVDALAAIVESSDDAIYSKDRNAIITSWNASAVRLYAYSREEAIGQPVSILIPEDKRGEELDILGRVLRGEKVEHYETQRVSKDGRVVDVSISVSPVHDKQGEIVEAAIIARDITEKKKLEAALAEARLHQVVESRQQALELNDEVVQGLAAAKMAMETGRHDQGLEVVAATLERAKGIVGRLLDQEGDEVPLEPGTFVRDTPAILRDPS